MAFTFPSKPKRHNLGEVQVELQDPNGTNGKRKVYATISFYDNDGRGAGSWNGEIKDLISAGMQADLVAFLNWVRAEAADKLLEE